MLSEYKKLDKESCAMEKQLQTLPSGKLICAQNGKYLKYYHSDGHTKTYIAKDKHHLAQQLAFKQYLLATLYDIKAEKRAIQFYLKHHKPLSTADTLLNTESAYFSLLEPYFTPLSQELADWTQAPYPQNEYHPEQRIHKSAFGQLVRSKSEAMIAMALCTYKIPFRYECALILGDHTVFPDFTIRHPQTGEVYYWEHFGLMDNPTYAKNACNKLSLYTAQNIIPTIQLITTFETKEHPLTTEIIKKQIEQYFL